MGHTQRTGSRPEDRASIESRALPLNLAFDLSVTSQCLADVRMRNAFPVPNSLYGDRILRFRSHIWRKFSGMDTIRYRFRSFVDG